MYVNVTISLNEGEQPPTKEPKAILTELGGDPEKDSISVTVAASYAPPMPPHLTPPPDALTPLVES